MKQSVTLSELNGIVHNLIELGMPDSYWVQAELSQVSEHNGHCYMELIEKDTTYNTPIAKASAKCWRNNWMNIRPRFEQITGQSIHSGIKVLLLVRAQFHENYGFSWLVEDIDATFTMGDMARKRMEILATLKNEGVLELQKELELPMFAQHIAVVSSATAAGYGDFCNQLTDNDYGFSFSTELFTAIMQGENVEKSVIAALNAINERAEEFDAVVIIRGGGATSDLSGFDTLALAENVANFPIPIITGIGHERDESVLDIISFKRVKTPTAAAVFLIDNLTNIYTRLTNIQDDISDYVKQRIRIEQMKVDSLSAKIPALFSVVKIKKEAQLSQIQNRLVNGLQSKTHDEENHITNLSQNIKPLLRRIITEENHKIDMLAQRSVSFDPQRLLKRGFSITLKDGKAVTDKTQLTSGTEIETRLYKGNIHSIVK